MLQNLKNRNKGFTIVEVMIVLAIAGLIILIVFLAVPTLQRNSRNTARERDVSRVLASVNECLSNRNGLTASCDTGAELVSNGGLDMNSLSQITTITDTGTLVAVNVFNTMDYDFSRQCLDDGSDYEASTNTRAYAATYRDENGGDGIARCISS